MKGSKVDPRKPPDWAVQKQHPQATKGICAWCGKPTSDKTETGRIAKYHHACRDERLCIISPEVMRGFVFARDKGVCAKCGEDWSLRFKFVREADVLMHESGNGWHSVPKGDTRSWIYSEEFRPFTIIRAVSLWHVEHTVPLWKVAHMAPEQRIEYFKLAAVKTYCTPCHVVKSRKEAADKAKVDRREKAKADKALSAERSAWANKALRKMQGRGFQKGYRPMRRR